MSNNIFIEASRKAIRFDTAKGKLTVEDLWSLPLTSAKGISLNGLAQDYYQAIQAAEVISFVKEPSSETTTLTLKFNIVKYIIDVRLAENNEATEAASKASKRAKIAELIEKKKDESLGSKSIEELEAELAAL